MGQDVLKSDYIYTHKQSPFFFFHNHKKTQKVSRKILAISVFLHTKNTCDKFSTRHYSVSQQRKKHFDKKKIFWRL